MRESELVFKIDINGTELALLRDINVMECRGMHTHL
jgi:hypothetical protein